MVASVELVYLAGVRVQIVEQWWVVVVQGVVVPADGVRVQIRAQSPVSRECVSIHNGKRIRAITQLSDSGP